MTPLITHSNRNSMMTMTRKTLLTLDRKRTRLHWLERKGRLLSCHQHTISIFCVFGKVSTGESAFSTTNVINLYAGWFPKKLSEAENSLMITICLMNALKIEIWQPASLHNYVSSQPNHVAIGITKVRFLPIQILVLGDNYKFICWVFLLPLENKYYNPQEHLLHTYI